VLHVGPGASGDDAILGVADTYFLLTTAASRLRIICSGPDERRR
jgi:hypothetical protein